VTKLLTALGGESEILGGKFPPKSPKINTGSAFVQTGGQMILYRKILTTPSIWKQKEIVNSPSRSIPSKCKPVTACN